MILSEKQRLFVRLQGIFINWCYENGYELTDGEALRDARIAELNAASGTGIANSLHLIRLARDWNLFICGEFQRDSAAYRPLGEFWKSLHPLCRWGGDFHKPDGDHFSLEHEGVK